MLSNRIIASRKRIADLKGFNGKKKPFGYSIYKDGNGIRRLKEHVLEQEVIRCIKDIYNSSEKYRENFKKFKEFVNNEFSRYTFTKLDLVRMIGDYYLERYTVKKSTSFVTDMIEGLKE
jgi:deoxyhypusine synthase